MAASSPIIDRLFALQDIIPLKAQVLALNVKQELILIKVQVNV